MAKNISYKNPTTGTMSPDSYWIPVQINLDVVNRRGMVTFYGWHDQSARAGGLQNIGQKTYSIDQAAYESHFSPFAQDEEGNNPVRAAYIFADSVLDIPRKITNESGEEVDSPVSFFEGATDC